MCHRVPVATSRAEGVARIRTRLHDEVLQAYLGGADLAGDVALVVSELASNAVQAGAANVEVVVDMHVSSLTVEVRDDAPGTPRLTPGSAAGVSGRGLAIVATLAEEWGVVPAADGGTKSVWATLRTGPDSRPVFTCDPSPPSRV